MDFLKEKTIEKKNSPGAEHKGRALLKGVLAFPSSAKGRQGHSRQPFFSPFPLVFVKKG